MQSNMYSNIGFRCESAYLAFYNYLINKTINKWIFEDSRRILNDCFQIEKNNDERSLIYDQEKNAEIESIQNIFFKYVMNKDNKKAEFSKLKDIYNNISNIESLNDNQINDLCNFFKEIVILCKDKTNNIMQNNNDENEFKVLGK